MRKLILRHSLFISSGNLTLFSVSSAQICCFNDDKCCSKNIHTPRILPDCISERYDMKCYLELVDEIKIGSDPPVQTYLSNVILRKNEDRNEVDSAIQHDQDSTHYSVRWMMLVEKRYNLMEREELLKHQLRGESKIINWKPATVKFSWFSLAYIHHIKPITEVREAIVPPGP